MRKLFWKSNSNAKASFLSPYYLDLAFQVSVTWLLGTRLESPVSAHKLLATVPSLMLASLLNHFIALGGGSIMMTRGTAAAQTQWLAQDSTQETEARGSLASGWTDMHTKIFILPKQTKTK